MAFGKMAGIKRLPVYCIIDTATVAGETPLAADWVATLTQHLARDPQTREAAEVSIIGFADQALQYPFTPVDAFAVPDMPSGVGHTLGAALKLLNQSLRQDLAPANGSRRGDYRPVAFIILRGQPTDDYASSLSDLHTLTGARAPRLLALGQTGVVTTTLLREITPHAYVLEDFTPKAVQQLIKMASNSITVASRGINGTVETPQWVQHEGPIKPAQ